MIEPDDFLLMRRGVADLNLWVQRQNYDPTMALAILVSVLSELATAYDFKVIGICEQLYLAGGDLGDLRPGRRVAS